MANGAGGQGGVPTGTGGFKGKYRHRASADAVAAGAYAAAHGAQSAGGMMQAGQYSGMSGPQSGYQTPQQLLTGAGWCGPQRADGAGRLALAATDERGTAGACRRGPGDAGAHQAGGAGRVSGQIDQNNAQAAYWAIRQTRGAECAGCRA